MNCVVLQNADGAHLGFMLCSPDLRQPSGDAVFMALPAQAELFDSPAAELLFQRKEAGESHWKVVGRSPLSVVVKTPGVAVEVFIEIRASGVGSWGVGSGANRKVIGNALIPPSPDGGASSK